MQRQETIQAITYQLKYLSDEALEVLLLGLSVIRKPTNPLEAEFQALDELSSTYEDDSWDKELKTDADLGKLEVLSQRAERAYRAGEVSEL